VALIRTVAGSDAVLYADMTINGRVLAFAVFLGLVTPFVFALLPAARSSGLEAREGLTDHGRLVTEGHRGHRLRGVLVACQVALALMLLVEIGLLVQTAAAFRNKEQGFDPRNVLTLHIDLPLSRYTETRQIRGFFGQVLARIEQLPGVRSVGAISRLPIADREVTVRFNIEGQPSLAPNEQPSAARAVVSPGYRKTMEIPLIEGRDLAATDSGVVPPAALINQVMARRHWPNGDAIGKRIRFDSLDSKWIEIVGVVGNVRNSDVDALPQAQVYVPSSQFPESSMAVVVRSEGSRPFDLTPAVRRLVSGLDKDQPIYDVSTMEQVLFDDLGGLYILVGILGGVALMVVGLAASGIYGVISYAVAQRTRELGIRMALGAEPRRLLRTVLAQSLVPVCIGGLLGLAGGVALVRLTSGALSQVLVPTGSATYVVVTVFLTLVALVASYLPARRVLRVDPMVALRHE